MAKKASPKQEVKQEDKTYHSAMWKDIRKVYVCDTCGTNRDDEDAMIEHVLLHVPFARQEELFNRMLKEKNK